MRTRASAWAVRNFIRAASLSLAVTSDYVPSAGTFSESFAESLFPLDAEYFLFKQKYGVSLFLFFFPPPPKYLLPGFIFVRYLLTRHKRRAWKRAHRSLVFVVVFFCFLFVFFCFFFSPHKRDEIDL